MGRRRRTAKEIGEDAAKSTRICRKCEVEKPIDDFRSRPYADGFHTQCKTCTDINSTKHYVENLDLRSEQSRVRRLKCVYGLTQGVYDELLAKQNGRCAICDTPATEFKINLAVDHDHASGQIRGLLCNYCNHRLVSRHTDGALLRKVADYIEQGTGLYVPPKPVNKKDNNGKST